jgi:hypothetical protein
MARWTQTVVGCRAVRSAPLAIGIALTVATPAVARVARADERPAARLVYLRGKGTESCPVETELRGAVQVRLGYDPFSTWAASTMFAEVGASGDGFTASVKLVDGDGSVRGDRVLRVKGRCAELIDAMALTMSIAIDPMSATRDVPTPGLPPSERSVEPLSIPAEARPEVDAAAAPEPERSEPPKPSERLRLYAGAGPLASLGTAPALAVGASIAVQAGLGRWLVGLEGRGDLPASAAALPVGRVESSLLAGALFVGAREGIVFAGVTGAVGRLSATSSEVREARRQHDLFLAAGFRLGVAIPLSDRVEARAHVDALANLLRHTLTINGADAYKYSIASGNLAVAIVVRFR